MTRTLSEQELVELGAWIDGELDAESAAAFQARLAADPALRAAQESLEAGRDALRRLPPPEVSSDFLQRIEALTAAPPVAAPSLRGQSWYGAWRSIAAAVVLTAFAASSATYLVIGSRAPSLLSVIADGHRRSLLASSPVDILSSDRHTVKPWLDAKLGVSPPAPDMAARTYPLVGGRVEVLGQQAVPALVYRHNEHTITVVAIPGSVATTAPHDFASGGYNMVQWSADGFGFTAVSDLEMNELEGFVADYEAAAGGAVTGK